MRTLFILPIEPIENRYPAHWYRYLPKQFDEYFERRCSDRWELRVVPGQCRSNDSGDVAFLNFIDTNLWKSEQMRRVSEMFEKGQVKDGDVFLVTDAWNPAIHQLRYMSELTGIKVRIVGVWHAGSYDDWDILGQTFSNKEWSYGLERSLYEVYDTNIFATEFHKNMFKEKLKISTQDKPWKSVVCGFPMEYMFNGTLKEAEICAPKKDMVIFPHRKSKEKQHDIAEDLGRELKSIGVDFYICHGKGLSIEEYHKKLAEAKVVFSASLQETLGIAQFEGMLHGAIPIQPNRLSYEEMYDPIFNYPSEWTEDYCSYKMNRDKLVDFIVDSMEDNESISSRLKENYRYISRKFFTGTEFYFYVLLDGAI